MISLYIHFPWCVKKCPYCDFNSHTLNGELPEKEYIQALLLNLKQSRTDYQGKTLRTIFMGGGTPSLFSPQSIDVLLKAIQQEIPFANDIEITLEANPGTVDQSRFKGYFEAGINRISLGIQSLNDHHLKALGRIHSASHAKRAVEAVKEAGFQHLNIDLMFGLPNQTIEQGLNDLKEGMALGSNHLSWYELTIEPNTFFWHHPPQRSSEDDIFDLQLAGQALLNENGFKQYEVSAYHRDKPCLHNVNYWEFGDYLAIGAGSHGKISHLDQNKIFRYQHFRSPKQYMDHSLGFLQKKQSVPSHQIAFEFMLNALRLTNGVPVDYFSARTGLALEVILDKLHLAKQRGWIMLDNERLCPTLEGSRFLNDLVSLFLPDHED